MEENIYLLPGINFLVRINFLVPTFHVYIKFCIQLKITDYKKQQKWLSRDNNLRDDPYDGTTLQGL